MAGRSESAQSLPGSPATTRDNLVELAAEVFATQGYASASVRDLSRRAGVTSGAIYGNFRGKADLLAAAVDARLTSDLWTLPDGSTEQPLIDVIGHQFEHYKSRTELMSLLLEGALAARADPEAKRRLHKTIARRLVPSAKAFESRRDAEGLDPELNLDAAVKMIWSIEIGLRVLSAFGFEAPAEEDCADVARRFVQGLQAEPTPRSAVRPTRSAGSTRSTKKTPVKKASAKPERKGTAKSAAKAASKKRA
jgi:AcrR family transcriptional regulator